jgi:UrcA family protein
MIRFISFISALAIAAGSFAPAQAADGFTAPKAVVKLNDLDLNNPKEAKVALVRIQHAASRVCSMGHSRPTSSQQALERGCAEAAIIAAVDGAHSQMLSAALAGKLGTARLARR